MIHDTAEEPEHKNAHLSSRVSVFVYVGAWMVTAFLVYCSGHVFAQLHSHHDLISLQRPFLAKGLDTEMTHHDHDTFFKTFIAELYDLHPVTLVPLGPSRGDQRVLYRVDHPSGASWVLRAAPQEDAVPWWFGGGRVDSWFHRQAATLRYLEQLHYPAPHLLPTRTGSFLGRHEGWCSLMITFAQGENMENSPENLYALASALGQLHTLPARGTTSPAVAHSWWSSHQTFGRARSFSLSQDIPPGFQSLASSVEQTLGVIQRSSHLPVTIIHGDCWPENALQTGPGSVMLLDWECAGLGAAALDIGGLLIDCHPDPGPGGEIQADPERIAAVLQGYCRERMLREAEVQALLQALRFSSAFQVAIRFSWAQEEGWSERIERSLARLHTRLRSCEQIAPIVLDQLRRMI